MVSRFIRVNRTGCRRNRRQPSQQLISGVNADYRVIMATNRVDKRFSILRRRPRPPEAVIGIMDTGVERLRTSASVIEGISISILLALAPLAIPVRALNGGKTRELLQTVGLFPPPAV